VRSSPFNSWFMAGFECSTMQFHDGRRVDAAAASGHDRQVAEDYGLVAAHGLLTARDGLRWPMIERTPGVYDWSSWLPMLRAADNAGVQVIWDLLHFGYPDWIADGFSPELPERFAAFCMAAARVFAEERDATPWWAPVNEISYWAWAAGHKGYFQPLGDQRGDECKRQLVRCAIAGMDACRAFDARARFVHTDPVVHVIPHADTDAARDEAGHERQLMFHSWDAVAGRLWPDLGGRPDLLDVVGVNYYADNQWVRDATRPEWALDRRSVGLAQPGYRPLHEILIEVWDRYGRPMIIAETGAEGANGPGWLRYVCGEVAVAREAGAVIEGVCLYPVIDYCGWGDGRHCRCGLIETCGYYRERRVDPLMARELERQTALRAWDERDAPAEAMVPADA